MQRDGLSDVLRNLRERGRFIFVEQIDHCRRGENAHLFRIELFGLAHQLAENFVAHGLRRFYFTAPLTRRTRLAEHVRERFARALAGHFDQAEMSEAVDGEPRAVIGNRGFECIEHGLAMFGQIHVDEIDDDDAAQIA